MFAVLQVPRLALQAVLSMAPESVVSPGTRLRGAAPRQAADATVSEEASLASRGVGAGEPVVVVDAGARKPVVLELTEAAGREGVVAGLSIPQALARCERLRVRHRSQQAERMVEALLFSLAYSLAPRVEFEGSGSVLVDLRGTQLEAVLSCCEGLVGELATLGLRAGIGVADSCVVASLAARQVEGGVLLVSGKGGNGGSLARDWKGERRRAVSGEAFLQDLPLSAVAMDEGLRAVLGKWGIHAVGAFAKLKRSAGGARLGVEGLQLWDRVTGREHRVVAVAELPPDFEESWDFEYEVDSMEPLLFLLNRFLDTLATRLRASHKVASLMQVELGLAYGEPLTVAQKLPEPTSDAEALFRLLAGRLEGLEAESPVVRMVLRLEALDVKQRQLGLFESSLKNPYRFTQTISRVAGIVGSERVGRPVLEADGRPDGFRLEALPASVSPWMKEDVSLKRHYGMPLRRFRPGLKAEVEFQGRRPIWFQCEAVSGFVKATRGPWLHSGHWWEEEGSWNRVEWDVELNKGGMYRITKDESGWKVEGCYG